MCLCGYLRNRCGPLHSLLPPLSRVAFNPYLILQIATWGDILQLHQHQQ